MSAYLASSFDISVFCEGMASMLGAGIQMDEAAYMLAEDATDSQYKAMCTKVYEAVASGKSLASAMEATEAFPAYAIKMVRMGERSGYIEDVLRQLAVYYEEEDQVFQKITSSVGYPAALLLIMSIIMVFIVTLILPVFVDVFKNYTGSITDSSSGFVVVAVSIGWVVLIVSIIVTVLALICVFMLKSTSGRNKVMSMLSKMPLTRKPMAELALSRTVSALAIFEVSGTHADQALREMQDIVENDDIREQLAQAYEQVTSLTNPVTMPVALRNVGIVDPIHARMLSVDTRSGSMGSAMMRISISLFNQAIAKLDRLIDAIEPVLAAFLTISVGLSLVSIMLPLIGIMGSIA